VISQLIFIFINSVIKQEGAMLCLGHEQADGGNNA